MMQRDRAVRTEKQKLIEFVEYFRPRLVNGGDHRPLPSLG
jgi:hypothetical protein